jgi:predicted transposase/invertase (TIGR01784 family)
MDLIDPRSDFGFKAVFVKRPHLFIHIINSLLKLSKPVVEIEYINPEFIPDLKNGKNSIVDAVCMDREKRQILVEMQVAQHSNYIKRTIFNAAKLYNRQLPKSGNYNELQPVYSINLLDHNIEKSTDIWQHDYKLTHQGLPGKHLNDINLVFFELPKWEKFNKFDIDNPLDRWMRYFTNPKFYAMMTLEERKKYEEITEAIEILNVSGYTPGQLRTYDLFLDNIRIRETDLIDARSRGMEEGMEKGIEKGMEKGMSIGLEKGIEKGREEGIEQGRELASDEIMLIITELKKMELSIEQIADKFNTSQEKVARYKSLIF